MTAQIQTFLQANPVTTTLSRAARWDKLKVDIQDVARSYCSTFLAQRTGQLRVLRARASQARAAYVAAPGCHHALDAFRRTAADLHHLTEGGQFPCNPKKEKEKKLADLCTMHGSQHHCQLLLS